MTSLRELSAQCVTCPRLCHSACPTAEVTGSGALSGWGLANLAHAIAVDALPRADRPAALDALATCNACGRCASFCRSHVDVPTLVELARGALLASEPLSVGLRDLLQEPMAHAAERRATPQGQWTWAPGCAAGSGMTADEVASMEQLLETVVEEELATSEPWGACQGGLARSAGVLPPRDLPTDRASGRIVGCLACMQDGREPGMHWIAWLDTRREVLAERYRATGLPAWQVTLHEGCGRGARALAPTTRRVLASVGVNVTLLRDSMDEPPCCGAEPLQRAAHPAISDALTQQFPDPGALVTLAPACAHRLREARGLSIHSLAETLLWRTGILNALS